MPGKKNKATKTITNTVINQSSKISIGLIITLVTMAGGLFVWTYNVVSAAIDTQNQRISTIESAVYSMSADIKATRQKVDDIDEYIHKP